MTSLARSVSHKRRLRILRHPTEPILRVGPRPQRRDCQGQLIAALEALAGPGSNIEDASMRPWCSATFVGAQHRFRLRLGGPDADACAQTFSKRLGEAEFALRGHVVVDATVDSSLVDERGDTLLALAILTIEDW